MSNVTLGHSMIDDGDFALHRQTRPYTMGVVLAVVVSLGIAYRVITAHDWRLIASLEIGWIMIAVWIYVGLRYQVLWRGGRVVMKALGRPDTEIAPDEIIQMAMDSSERMRIAGLGKPSQRIKILAKEPGGEPKSVYVSLGHFAAPDIARLMRVIGSERPDLAFPAKWLRDAG